MVIYCFSLLFLCEHVRNVLDCMGSDKKQAPSRFGSQAANRCSLGETIARVLRSSIICVCEKRCTPGCIRRSLVLSQSKILIHRFGCITRKIELQHDYKGKGCVLLMADNRSRL